MSNGNWRRRYRQYIESNQLGDIARNNCNGVLGENYNCNRRAYPGAAALEDAYNAGYCEGARDAYEQGLRDGCRNTKENALDCINRIRCN